MAFPSLVLDKSTSELVPLFAETPRIPFILGPDSLDSFKFFFFLKFNGENI